MFTTDVLLVDDANRPGASSPHASFAFDVAVVGLGYVGLPTALALHAAGQRVMAIDISPRRLDDIRARDVDLAASDLNRLDRALDDPDHFHMMERPGRVGDAAVVIVCVPTPVDHHLAPDLTALAAACSSVVAHVNAGQTIVLTSTTYVGCTRQLLVRPLTELGLTPGRDVFVAFAPERIDPGNDRHHQHDVPRVIGGITVECVERASATLTLCASYVHRVSSLEAAEMTKLYENTFRAVNISLANEFADISRTLRLDITEVIDAASTKPYGFMPFRPGAGVGGHCIPCDPHYLLWQLRAERVHAPMIETAMTLVAQRPSQVVRRVGEVLAESGRTLAGADILVLGVAYKPGVSDVRESPALEIMDRLTTAGANVAYADDLVPAVRVAAGDVKSIVDPEDRDWDLVVVHTVHPGADTDWLRRHPVLDTTYRLDLAGRRTL